MQLSIDARPSDAQFGNAPSAGARHAPPRFASAAPVQSSAAAPADLGEASPWEPCCSNIRGSSHGAGNRVADSQASTSLRDNTLLLAKGKSIAAKSSAHRRRRLFVSAMAVLEPELPIRSRPYTRTSCATITHSPSIGWRSRGKAAHRRRKFRLTSSVLAAAQVSRSCATSSQSRSAPRRVAKLRPIASRDCPHEMCSNIDRDSLGFKVDIMARPSAASVSQQGRERFPRNALVAGVWPRWRGCHSLWLYITDVRHGRCNITPPCDKDRFAPTKCTSTHALSVAPACTACEVATAIIILVLPMPQTQSQPHHPVCGR